MPDSHGQVLLKQSPVVLYVRLLVLVIENMWPVREHVSPFMENVDDPWSKIQSPLLPSLPPYLWDLHLWN